MKKVLKVFCLVASFTLAGLSSANSDVDNALDKTKEGAVELFEIAKEKGAEIGSNLLEKGGELSEQAGERAQESGEIFWEKMKKIGSASKQLAQDGSQKLKELTCDLADAACQEKAATEPEGLDESI